MINNKNNNKIPLADKILKMSLLLVIQCIVCATIRVLYVISLRCTTVQQNCAETGARTAGCILVPSWQ